MKKTFLLIMLAMSMAFVCPAQNSQRQKAIHMAAIRIADEIGLGSDKKEAFVEIYQDYKKESAAIMNAKGVLSDDPELAAEQKILSDFEKSEKILALRKSYYSKFRTLLSATQVQKMYDAERGAVQKQ